MARAYDTRTRELAARETRQRILTAARQLMLEGGYRAMTVAQLAAHAGGSTQTVYNSVGTTTAVAKAGYDELLAGEAAPVPMSDRPEFVAVRRAADVQAWARSYAAWT